MKRDRAHQGGVLAVERVRDVSGRMSACVIARDDERLLPRCLDLAGVGRRDASSWWTTRSCDGDREATAREMGAPTSSRHGPTPETSSRRITALDLARKCAWVVLPRRRRGDDS